MLGSSNETSMQHILGLRKGTTHLYGVAVLFAPNIVRRATPSLQVGPNVCEKSEMWMTEWRR